MAGGIVDDLELIQIDECRHERLAARLVAPQRHVESVLEVRAIGEAGQGIVRGLVPQLIGQPPLRSHVAHDENHPDHLALGISERRRPLADGRAAAVAADQLRGMTRDQRILGFGHEALDRLAQRWGRDIAGMVQPEHALEPLAARLRHAPARQLFRGAVHELDDAAAVRRDHRIADRIQQNRGTLVLFEHQPLGRPQCRGDGIRTPQNAPRREVPPRSTTPPC